MDELFFCSCCVANDLDDTAHRHSQSDSEDESTSELLILPSPRHDPVLHEPDGDDSQLHSLPSSGTRTPTSSDVDEHEDNEETPDPGVFIEDDPSPVRVKSQGPMRNETARAGAFSIQVGKYTVLKRDVAGSVKASLHDPGAKLEDVLKEVQAHFEQNTGYEVADNRLKYLQELYLYQYSKIKEMRSGSLSCCEWLTPQIYVAGNTECLLVAM